MKVGIPKETFVGETRVATTPEIAKKLIATGFEVAVERGAGVAAHYSDAAYEAVGAVLTDTAGAFDADIVAKVRKPTPEEAELVRSGAVFIGYSETCDEDPAINKLHQRGVTFVAMEKVPRISRAQSMDALSSQASIAGYQAVLDDWEAEG